MKAEKNGYLWQRSYILCVWRPGTPPPQPAWRYAHLGDPPPAASRFHMRQCRECGRMRVLPRWADPEAPALRAAAFRCSANPDRAHAACSVPEFLPICVP